MPPDLLAIEVAKASEVRGDHDHELVRLRQSFGDSNPAIPGLGQSMHKPLTIG